MLCRGERENGERESAGCKEKRKKVRRMGPTKVVEIEDVYRV
jgi:hypothetical protein